MKITDKNRIIIKRYGNRRLYNTETSSYVNYQEISELIREGRDIQVIDSKTKEDITRLVLLQIILEEGQDLLPTPFLYQLIRTQEESLHEFFQNYLSASFDAYMKTKQEFDRRFRSWLDISASAPQMLENFFNPPGASKTDDSDKDKG
jgi:polyhydroxyalkanoate synthesis repressor PhaR